MFLLLQEVSMFLLLQKIYMFLLLQKVYCGHEYTVSNLRYALTVEPENKDLQKKIGMGTGKLLFISKFF